MRAEFVGALAGLYPEELEASLCAQYPGRDPIAEFWRGQISPRQLRVLAEGLGPGSPLARARNGHSWTEHEWIAHDTNWQLRQLLALTYNVNAEKGKSAPEPKPLPTPFDEGTVTDALELEYIEGQRAEMDALAERMFSAQPTE